jgi:acyl carrier protein
VAATRAQTDPVAYLRARIADSTGHPVERIAADRSPVALGVDSMAAVTLVNRIRRDFGAELDVAEVLTSPSIEALAARLGRAPRQ